MSKTFNPEAIAEVIGVPVKDWPGRCHEIAGKIVASGLIEGRTQYGFFHGFVSPLCTPFNHRAPFQRHGWIRTTDDQIVDPTRWVFEAADPYIYVGPAGSEEYDLGMSSIRRQLRGEPPQFDPKDEPFELRMKAQTVIAVHRMMLERSVVVDDLTLRLSRSQGFWLANDPDMFVEPHAKDVYNALDRVGHLAWVPIDFYEEAMAT